jgi:hypothetical protein
MEVALPLFVYGGGGGVENGTQQITDNIFCNEFVDFKCVALSVAYVLLLSIVCILIYVIIDNIKMCCNCDERRVQPQNNTSDSSSVDSSNGNDIV